MKKTAIILMISVLVVTLSFILIYYFKYYFPSIPNTYIKCSQDSDCIIAFGGEHPCNCWTPINKQYEEQFEKRINEIHLIYAKRGKLVSCAECPEIKEGFRNSAVCRDNKCTHGYE